jgi:hypothetical protein
MESIELLKILDGMKFLQAEIGKMREKMASKSSYTTSPETDKLDAAFAKAQLEFGVPDEKGTSNYGSYSTAKDLIKAVRPALNKNGITLKQIPIEEDGNFYLITRISHAGQFEQGKMWLSVTDDKKRFNQDLGGSITYQRRYALSSFLGIGGADDIDPDAIEKKDAEKQKQAQQRRLEQIPPNTRLEHLKQEHLKPEPVKPTQQTFTPQKKIQHDGY